MHRMGMSFLLGGLMACGEPPVVLAGDSERAASFAESMSELDCGLQASCEAEGPVPVVTDVQACAVDRAEQILSANGDCPFYPEESQFCLDLLESLDCVSYFMTDWWSACRLDLIWQCPN